MIIPIRCFSCGKPIAQIYEKYLELIKKESPKKALEDLGIERYCCRTMFLTHVELIDTVAKFKKA